MVSRFDKEMIKRGLGLQSLVYKYKVKLTLDSTLPLLSVSFLIGFYIQFCTDEQVPRKLQREKSYMLTFQRMFVCVAFSGW